MFRRDVNLNRYKNMSLLLNPNIFFFSARYFGNTLVWCIKGLFISVCHQLSVFPNNQNVSKMFHHIYNTFRKIFFYIFVAVLCLERSSRSHENKFCFKVIKKHFTSLDALNSYLDYEWMILRRLYNEFDYIELCIDQRLARHFSKWFINKN